VLSRELSFMFVHSVVVSPLLFIALLAFGCIVVISIPLVFLRSVTWREPVELTGVVTPGWS
jgi:hypothetical protein